MFAFLPFLSLCVPIKYQILHGAASGTAACVSSLGFVFVCGVAQVSLPLSVCRLESRNNVVLYD